MSEHHEFGEGGIANFDQRQAEALERLRSNRHGFVLFTIEDGDESKIALKYVGSMDERYSKAFLLGIMEIAEAGLRAAIEIEEDDEDD